MKTLLVEGKLIVPEDYYEAKAENDKLFEELTKK